MIRYTSAIALCAMLTVTSAQAGRSAQCQTVEQACGSPYCTTVEPDSCQSAKNDFMFLTRKFANCILDEVAGSENDIAARAAYEVCHQKYPGDLGFTFHPPKFPWSYNNGLECAAKKAKDTRSTLGANVIRRACGFLYDGP